MLMRLLPVAAELWDATSGGLRGLWPGGLTRQTDPRTPRSSASRVVVACVYEREPRPDLLALFSKFRNRGFETVVVSSNKAHMQYLDATDVTIAVAPAGRDFLAYQQGYRFARDRFFAKDDAGIVFLNDSVWYFDKHQNELVDRIVAGIDAGALVAGSMILDEVPHVSGWLFAAPFNEYTREELDQLFRRKFTRKSRRYNIRFGEHRILPALASVKEVMVLDAQGQIPAIAHCYEAVALGKESFYLKADTTVRVDAARSNLKTFLQLNSEVEEARFVLRWLARRASSIINTPLRMWEATAFRNRYFPPGPTITLALNADTPAVDTPRQTTKLPGEALRRLAS